MQSHKIINRMHQLNLQFAARSFNTPATEPKVIFKSHTPQVFEFILNKPKALNAVDTDMCNLMASKLREWQKNPVDAPRVMLMSGAGEKAFCAGGDIVSLYHGKKEGVPNQKLLEFFSTEYLLDYSLSQLKAVQQISVWNGFVMGGGVGLTWHSPIRIATESSLYAMPETAIGFFTDVGGSYFLPRIKNGDFSLGLYLGLTGARVQARDLVKYGLATHFVKQEDMEHLYEMLQKGVSKHSSADDIEKIVTRIADPEASIGQIRDHDEIKKIFRNDSIQACMQRLEESHTEFANSTKKVLTKMSPLSMAIVFEQLKRGAKLSVRECFEMEYKIAAGFFDHTEFFEGVRALLVDKDKQPKWHYKTVSQIKTDDVAQFFNRSETLNLDLYKDI